ncbi:hypothetical protein GRX03_05525 [Halovenus sp. WSH3]|uniref:Uncharacterized protein n=1 Tax=Halovenus carboxidivorans TaxID=2692199 RepID=A0A6B0T4G0_9EURY|nr:hypothetical protein [Halovenus carboxidivorans]MXR51066.1 hypothetical protein [Halovenus carboxidivorans]
MRRKAVTLLAAVAVAFVAVGGVAAADHSAPAELAPEDENSTGGDVEVGVCVVGVDSPCNGERAEEFGDDSSETNDSERKMWIPEDQNRDGEIDDRFVGDGDSEESGDNANESTRIVHPTPGTDDPVREDGGAEMWIPEDQNRDGEIDDRFLPNSPDPLGGVLLYVLAVL